MNRTTSAISGHRWIMAFAIVLACVIGATTLLDENSKSPALTSQNRQQPASYKVVRQDFESVHALDAQVQRRVRTELFGAAAGAEIEWHSSNGGEVQRGDVLFAETGADNGTSVRELRAQLGDAQRSLQDAPETALAREAVRELQRRLGKAEAARRRVTADRSGIVRILSRAVASPDAPVGYLEATGYVVQASLDPLVLYRLGGGESKGTAELPGTGLSFSCDGVTVAGEVPDASPLSTDRRTPGATNPSEEGRTDATSIVECGVPDQLRVVPGLKGLLVLRSTLLPAVLTVSADAVGNISGNAARVTVLTADGSRESREVEIGPSNGVIVVVNRGLAEGETVLLRAAEDSRSTPSEG